MTSDKKEKGNPKPQDKISSLLVNLLLLIEELKIKIKEPERTSHLTDNQSKILIKLVEFIKKLLNILLTSFWTLPNQPDLEEKLDLFVKRITKND